MFRDVFAECVRTLEPGGRIAVNVANLGRTPYRSLSADVTTILQDDLRLLLRGEVVWVKQRGAAGTCAWGCFQRPDNPVLRDLTERVIIAEGPLRPGGAASDAPAGPAIEPHDVSRRVHGGHARHVGDPARVRQRVGHPAPFPVALPERLIHLYTYEGDLVLDPFMGSGTTAVAAVRTGRHFVGYDTDAAYVEEAAPASIGEGSIGAGGRTAADDGRKTDPQRGGWASKELAKWLLGEAGFTDIDDQATVVPGVAPTLRRHVANREGVVVRGRRRANIESTRRAAHRTVVAGHLQGSDRPRGRTLRGVCRVDGRSARSRVGRTSVWPL